LREIFEPGRTNRSIEIGNTFRPDRRTARKLAIELCGQAASVKDWRSAKNGSLIFLT